MGHCQYLFVGGGWSLGGVGEGMILFVGACSGPLTAARVPPSPPLGQGLRWADGVAALHQLQQEGLRRPYSDPKP